MEEVREESVDLKIARRVAAATLDVLLRDSSPERGAVRVENITFLVFVSQRNKAEPERNKQQHAYKRKEGETSAAHFLPVDSKVR